MAHPPPPPVCPVDALLRLLMGSWTTHILWQLRKAGPLRYGALLRAVPGISSKVLTQRLRLLEAHGIVYRRRVATNPPEVSYGLAARGTDLTAVFEALEDVSRRWLDAAGHGREPPQLAAPSPAAATTAVARPGDRLQRPSVPHE